MRAHDPIPPSRDPLAEALHSLRMSGLFYCRCELSEPWGLSVPAMPGSLWFHIVTSGHASLEVDDAGTQAVRPGDLALVPHGRGHALRSEPDAAASSVVDLPHDFVSDRYAILRHGGGGDTASLICGAVRFEHPAAHDLISQLPDLIHLEQTSPVHTDWMRSTLSLIAAETAAVRPGGETVTTRLADIIVIHAIRSWIEDGAQPGWLGAVRDPCIGPAITLIQRDPARQWTVAALAREVAMSRSAFSARFSRLVAEPPMAYVSRWRMYTAISQLRNEERTVSQLAAQLGYHSDAAFSRAFKRVIGIPPSEVKRGDAYISPALAGPIG